MKKLWLAAAAALYLCAGSAFAADDTLTIGFTVSQTGSLNLDSIAQLHGFEMWRDDVNTAGGIKAADKRFKIALVYSDDPFSKAVAISARDQAKQSGLQIVLDEAYPPNQTDFSAIINKIVSSGADTLLGGGHYPDGATLARQLYDQKAKLKWATLLVAPDSPQFASLGGAAEGISVGSQWAPQVTYKPDFGPTPADFAKRFQAKFNIAAGYHAAGGYAAGLLLQHAIEQAGSIDPEKVAAELNKMNVTTMFGATKFSTEPRSHGLQVAHQMVLLQWQMSDGHLDKQVIWPLAAATAPAKFPYR
jgi:branched-chain amino acid transport system substrate-binding protein